MNRRAAPRSPSIVRVPDRCASATARPCHSTSVSVRGSVRMIAAGSVAAPATMSSRWLVTRTSKRCSSRASSYLVSTDAPVDDVAAAGSNSVFSASRNASVDS